MSDEKDINKKSWEVYSKNKCVDCNKVIPYYSKRCRKCYAEIRRVYKGEKLKSDGTISNDSDYLSKKAWRERNKEKDRLAKKKWLINNPEKRKEASRKWDKGNLDKKRVYIRDSALRYPEKLKARRISKSIVRKDKCEVCGHSGEKYSLEKHHPDYSKPKYTITLCKKCHVGEHYGR